MIGDDIEVIVLGIGTSQVRLGVSAPREVSVLRDNAVVKYRKVDKDD